MKRFFLEKKIQHISCSSFLLEKQPCAHTKKERLETSLIGTLPRCDDEGRFKPLQRFNNRLECYFPNGADFINEYAGMFIVARHLRLVRLTKNLWNDTCETHSRRKHKRNHEREGVCTPRYRILLIFINFNFDFRALYKMYFQNYFANRFIKLESFTSTIYNLRVRVV